MKILLSLLYFACMSSLGFLTPADTPWWAFGLYALAHVFLYGLLFFSFNKDKKKSARSIPLSVILIGAFILRLVFLQFPASDDAYRYAWEGKMLNYGYNPYQAPPIFFGPYCFAEWEDKDYVDLKEQLKNAGLSLDDEFVFFKSNSSALLNELLNDEGLIDRFKLYIDKKRLAYQNLELISKRALSTSEKNRFALMSVAPVLSDPIYEGINHKRINTVYPPVGVWVFSKISSISYSMMAFKAFFLVCDLCIILLMIPLLKSFGRPLEWLALYAWSPLVVLYGVGEGHFDVLHLLFIAIALNFFYVIPKKYTALGFLFLGLAVMTKYLSLIILPFVLKRSNLKWAGVFLVPFLSFVPFWDENAFDGLMKFSSQMHYNDVFPRFLRMFLEEGTWAYRLGMLALFVGGFAWFWLFMQEDRFRALSLSWMWILLCLPVVHPWYLMPVIFFMAFYPNRAWFVLSTVLGLHFFVLNYQSLNDGMWKEFSWISYCTFLSFFGIVCWDYFRNKCLWSPQFSAPRSIDIVIPVLNEEGRISGLLNSIHEQSLELIKQLGGHVVIETYVCDGGSTDRSIEMVENSHAKLINVIEKGRGNQIAQGIKEGSGDVLLVLHADSVLRENALRALWESLEQDPAIGWGVLGHSYDKNLNRLKIIEFLNFVRIQYLGIGFGDQGMFLRRAILKDISFPEIPLMEDIEFSVLLRATPHRKNLKGYLVGSARRWEKKKFVNSVAYVFYVCIYYLFYRRFGGNVKILSQKIYQKYYS